MSNCTGSALRSLSTEKEVAVILSHFNSDYILNVIEEKLSNRYTFSIASIDQPNIVVSFKDNFYYLSQQFSFDLENIRTVEERTYEEIIEIICKNYGLYFYAENDNYDRFTQAYYLYDFFIANFSKYISLFFARFIFANRQSIYTNMNLDQFKKSKDSSSVYGKKIYDDPYIGGISANIGYVIENMKAFDIPLESILSTIYGAPNIIDIFTSSIGVSYDFFKTMYCNIPAEFNSILITNIRLELQSIAINEMNFKTAWDEMNNNN